MKRFIKGSSFLFYLLTILVFFFVGVGFVGITGAAEGQGLAGGAIVVGYGIVFAFVALIGSFVMVYYSSSTVIQRANFVLFFLLLIFASYFAYRFLNRDQYSANSHYQPLPKLNTLAVSFPQQAATNNAGLGFFKPKLFNAPALYFYGKPNFDKATDEHSPFDSLCFYQTEHGGYNISYAPPWFVPHHLKLDYDLLFLKVIGMGNDFAEIIVNTGSGQTAYIDRYAGDMLYWPDFLLSVNSIEMLPNRPQKVRVKPLSYAGEVNIPFEFMKPVLVMDHWVQVYLLDDNFRQTGEGWIKWQDEAGLLVRYSLLS